MAFISGARAAAALPFLCLALAGSLIAGCGQKPVAEVNGVKLTDEAFAREMATMVDYNPQQGGTVGLQALMQWIRNTVFAQLARQQNVYPSQDEVNRRIDSLRGQARWAGTELEQQLRDQGLTMDAFREDVTNSLVAENLIAKGVTVSDEEVRKAFDQQKAAMTQPSQIEISQITVDTRQAMEQVREDLASNTDFKLVASTRSKDPFADGGGAVPFPLGPQVQQGMPVSQEVLDAAWKLDVGEVSKPIKVGATWVFVRLEKKTPAKEPDFENFSDPIRSVLRRQKADQSGQSQRSQQEMMQAMQQAKITINRPEYQIISERMRAQAQAQPAAGAPVAPPDGASIPHGQPGHVHGDEEGGAPPPAPPDGASIPHGQPGHVHGDEEGGPPPAPGG